MADTSMAGKAGEIHAVTEDLVRRYIAVLRHEQPSADDCWQLLLARARAKRLLDASSYDQAVALAHSFGGN
jgi:polyphosphate kinase 2 (PPK2 family)